MPRHHGSRFGHKATAKEVLRHAEHSLYLPARDLSQESRLKQLFAFCDLLDQWAGRFVTNAPMFAHSAALVSDDGLAAFLESVNGQLEKFAPAQASSRGLGAQTPRESHSASDKSGLARVEELLNVLMHMSEYLVGTFEWEPSGINTTGHAAQTAAWQRSWRPPDEELLIYVQQKIIELREIERCDITRARVRATHGRLTSAARSVIRDFTKRMNQLREDVGLKHIKRLLDARGNPDSEKAFRDFAAAVGQVAATTSERAGPPAFSQVWHEAVSRLLDTRLMYSEECLSLLRSSGVTRVGLQKKREQLRSWVALVAQYLFLVQGNARRARFAALCEGIRLAAREICAELARTSRLSFDPMPQESLIAEVAALDRLVVDPRVAKLWAERLGRNAKQFSTLASTIAAAQAGSTKPWTLGDHLSKLRAAGVLTRNGIRGKTDQLQQLLYTMQELGLAVQVPWGYINGEDREWRRNDREGALSRRGLGWLVSPLGACLSLPPKVLRPAKRKSSKSPKISKASRANAKPKRGGRA